MFPRDKLEQFSKEELIIIIEKQAERIKELEEKVKQLENQVEEMERISKRQAAPFRVKEEKRVENPKNPGREFGHKGSYRQIPEHIDDEIEVPLKQCPKCGGEISSVEAIEQYIEEIPVITPKRYKLRTYSGYCKRCGRVQSTHPLKTSEAVGAAKVQLGPRAKAIGLRLQYEYGLTKRKTSSLMEEMFGLPFSCGGWVYAAHKMGKKCNEEYEALMENARQSDYLHSDETSWYVGNPKSWLWVFANDKVTLYKVSDNRSRETIIRVIGDDYKGVLVSDCLVIYDDINPSQHKCYSHHLKAISQAKESHPQQGKGFLNDMQQLLTDAIELKKKKGQIEDNEYKNSCLLMEQQADRLLEDEKVDLFSQKVANRITKQRDHLFTFLYHDKVDATNNLAERQLRPAVISRKISCGNKTHKGAHTWEVLSSLIVTQKQASQDLTQYFCNKAIFSG